MLNEKKKKNDRNKYKEYGMRKDAHRNYMDGLSYDLSPFARLYVMATSAFFGEDGYYGETRRGETPKSIHVEHAQGLFGSFGIAMVELFSCGNRAEAMKKAIDESLAYDAELTLKFLAWLRREALIRATPAVGLAVASRSDAVRNLIAEKGSSAFRDCAQGVLSRLDDATNCLAYYLKEYGKPIPNSLKKVLAKRVSDAKEYELAKYAGKNKDVSLKDVIRLTHAHSNAVDLFYNDRLSQAQEGNETWEAIISREGSNKESWTKAVGVMGHMALLRNLRNLARHEVDKGLYLQKLIDGVKTGKQLPFRYYSAWQEVYDADVRRALEKCIDISIENLPKLPGRSLILVDNSGSARHCRVSKMSNVSVSVAGNLMGVLTGLVSESGKIGAFGDKIKYLPINSGFKGTALGLLNVLNDEIGATVGQGTENGIWLALDDAIRSGEKFDRIFIYSDMQAGHGGLYGIGSEYPKYDTGESFETQRFIDVPLLVSEYRKRVNPDCKLYSIQIGGYSDNIFPEFYPNTCIMGGWSTEILKFVDMFEKNPAEIEGIFRKKFALPKR